MTYKTLLASTAFVFANLTGTAFALDAGQMKDHLSENLGKALSIGLVPISEHGELSVTDNGSGFDVTIPAVVISRVEFGDISFTMTAENEDTYQVSNVQLPNNVELEPDAGDGPVVLSYDSFTWEGSWSVTDAAYEDLNWQFNGTNLGDQVNKINSADLHLKFGNEPNGNMVRSDISMGLSGLTIDMPVFAGTGQLDKLQVTADINGPESARLFKIYGDLLNAVIESGGNEYEMMSQMMDFLSANGFVQYDSGTSAFELSNFRLKAAGEIDVALDSVTINTIASNMMSEGAGETKATGNLTNLVVVSPDANINVASIDLNSGQTGIMAQKVGDATAYFYGLKDDRSATMADFWAMLSSQDAMSYNLVAKDVKVDMPMEGIELNFNSAGFGMDVSDTNTNSGNIGMTITLDGLQTNMTQDEMNSALMPESSKVRVVFAGLPMQQIEETLASIEVPGGMLNPSALEMAFQNSAMQLLPLVMQPGPRLVIEDTFYNTNTMAAKADGEFVFNPMSQLMTKGNVNLLISGLDALTSVAGEQSSSDNPMAAQMAQQLGFVLPMLKGFGSQEGDTYKYDVAVTEEGEITVNGQPVPFF